MKLCSQGIRILYGKILRLDIMPHLIQDGWLMKVNRHLFFQTRQRIEGRSIIPLQERESRLAEFEFIKSPHVSAALGIQQCPFYPERQFLIVLTIPDTIIVHLY